MWEREPGKEASQGGESILTQEFIEPILTVTKEFLKFYDRLGPALFLHLENDEQGVVPLAYLDSLKSAEERREYFTSLGLSIRLAGNRIREALFVSEVWYVEPEEEGTLNIAPSKHPNRKEAISIVGRNSHGTRFTQVLQPFSRDIDNAPIFKPLIEAEYDVSAEEGHRPVGLMDHLFG